MSVTSIALVVGTVVLLLTLRWLRPPSRCPEQLEAAGQENDRLARFLTEAEAALAAAERKTKELEEHWREANLKAADVRDERDAWREQALSAASPEEVSESHDNWMYRAKGAERRLAIAREALERICEAFGHTEQELKGLAHRALAALDGEGE